MWLQIVCPYLFIIKAVQCFCDKLNVLVGQNHQFTVMGLQIDIL